MTLSGTFPLTHRLLEKLLSHGRLIHQYLLVDTLLKATSEYIVFKPSFQYNASLAQIETNHLATRLNFQPTCPSILMKVPLRLNNLDIWTLYIVQRSYIVSFPLATITIGQKSFRFLHSWSIIWGHFWTLGKLWIVCGSTASGSSDVILSDVVSTHLPCRLSLAGIREISVLSSWRASLHWLALWVMIF